MKDRAIHAVVHGIVQGVAFRYHTRHVARELSLAGWVRNLPSGTVEVWAEGDEDSLKSLAVWLERGPSMARVDHLDIEWKEPRGEQGPFDITF